MCVLLVVFLSTVMFHSVSSGGVYCAKTARARAAALGLDYPGVHGAPDLYGPGHYEMHHSTMPLSSYLYKNSGPELAEIDPNIAYPVRSSDDGAHKQAHPWSSESTFQLIHGAYNPVESEYATEQVLSLPRGQPVSNSESNFEEVKHVAPPTWAETPGQPELMNWQHQGHTELLPFVYNEHDLIFDESVPNRHAMSLNRLPLPQSRGHGTYQRGLTGYDFGFGREVPVLGSSHFVNQPHRAMTRRGPMSATWERFPIWFPPHHAQLLHRNINIKQPVQGNPFLKPVIKPIPVRISP